MHLQIAEDPVCQKRDHHRYILMETLLITTSKDFSSNCTLKIDRKSHWRRIQVFTNSPSHLNVFNLSVHQAVSTAQGLCPPTSTRTLSYRPQG